MINAQTRTPIIAVILVGGGILVHGFHILDVVIVTALGPLEGSGALLMGSGRALATVLFGVIAGALVVGLQAGWHKIRS